MAGDDKISEVLDTYEAVLAFFRARLANHERTEADDLAQETILAALKEISLERRDEIRSVPRFTLGIAQNKFADFLRRKPRHRVMPLDSVSDDGHVRSVADRTQLVRLVDEEQCRILMEAIEHLKADERRLLQLRCVEGLSNATAADRLGMAPEEASRVFYRVRAALKTEVAEKSRGVSHRRTKGKGR